MGTWENSNTYEVDEIGIELESEVLETILRRNSILKYATENQIPALMACLKPIPVSAGKTIIQQGNQDKDLYIISKGKCRVDRVCEDKHHLVAELSDGDTFGEEAVITNAPRNASVTVLEDSILLRMNKEDFNQFLKPVIVNYLDIKQCQTLIEQGAHWVDTRRPAQHEINGVGMNIPLSAARIHASELNRTTPYILYCDDARISTVVSMIFKQHDITSYVLKGGLSAYKESGASLLPLKANHTTESSTTLQNKNIGTPAHNDEDKQEVNHYKDLLIELTINSQKEIRKLKALHQQEIQHLQETMKMSTSPNNKVKTKFCEKDLLKQISYLEKMLTKKEQEIEQLTEKLDNYDVNQLAQLQVVQAYQDIKEEYERKEREYEATISAMQQAKNNNAHLE